MSDRATMRCADAEPYLSALADGELAEPLRSAVAAHAASCARCGEILARHQAVNSLFAALPASTPAPSVLDRVLSATATTEPAQRESMRRGISALAVRRAVRRLALPQSRPAPALALPRQRSFWQSTALPALAAVLLITFAFAAFSRIAPTFNGSPTARTATATPQGDAYQQAQVRVAAEVAAHPISYTPEIPWSLPAGAAFQSASLDPATGTLDIAWTLTNTLTLLHVREAPVALARWGDYHPLADASNLAWQLPGKAAWQAGSFAGDTARLAVVQDDTTFSAAVDVSFPNDAEASQVGDPTLTLATNVLRLASLSMDSTRFAVPALNAPDVSTAVIHYTAQSGSGASLIQSDVYVDPVGKRARVIVSDNQGELYVDFISGADVTRYDPRHHTYSHLSKLSTPLGDVPLDGRTTNFFNLVNNHLAYGDLWYVGVATWSGVSADELAVTTAPYRTIVYVDAATHNVLGATVTYSEAQNLGASGLTSYFTHNNCLSYTSIEYLTSIPAGAFNAPQGDLAGTPPATVTCPA